MPLASTAARRAGLLLVTRSVSYLGYFSATVLVARRLGPSTYGRYAVALALGSVVVGGFSSGVPILVTREAARQLVDRSFLAVALRAQLGVGLACVAVVVALGPVFLGGASGAFLALLGGLHAMGLALFAFFSGLRAGYQQLVRIGVAEVLLGAASLGGTQIALSAGAGTHGAVGALLAGSVVATAYLTVGVTRQVAPSLSRPDATRVARQAIPFVASGIANAWAQQLDTLVTRLAAGQQVAGLYAASYRVLGPLRLGTSSFGTVFFPKLAAADEGSEQWSATLRRGRRGLLLVFAPAAALAFVVMPTLVDLLYGPAFAAAVTPARILVLTALPLAVYWPLAHALMSTGRERFYASILLAGLALDAALVTMLSPRHGATGSALAWLVTECLILALVWLVARHHRDRARETGPSRPTSRASVPHGRGQKGSRW